MTDLFCTKCNEKIKDYRRLDEHGQTVCEKCYNDIWNNGKPRDYSGLIRKDKRNDRW